MDIKRNQYVDWLRGIAMLLVVLGHTMQCCTTDSNSTVLYNIIWSIQMPLFFLISGYVLKYSHGIHDSRDLRKLILKRTMTYLIPWLVWSIIIRGIIFGQHGFLNMKNLLWHMDSGYWFLVSIWTICIIFGVSSFVAGKVSPNNKFAKTITTAGLYLCGMAVLAGIGHFTGLSFFSIKLTLYYMPFYFAGYLYGEYQDVLSKKEWYGKVQNILVLFCLLSWLYIIRHFTLFELSDSGLAVILRIFTSLSGCLVLCELFKGIPDNCLSKYISWIGVHSLEIYLAHYLLLNPLKIMNRPPMSSTEGYVCVAANYLVTVGLVSIAVFFLNSNNMTKYVLFGKKTK